MKQQKIVPFLWFDREAEAAAKFYVSIFKNSRITGIARYGEGSPGPKGQVMTVDFQLEGQDFIALNGGPVYKLTPAISLFVNCATQVEVDVLWRKLSQGAQPGQCAWLTDKFGVTWQIVPTILRELLGDPDPAKAARAMQAMLKMGKINIKKLQAAHAG